MLALDPATIDFMALPSLPLAERALLPKVAAVYFVIDVDQAILYIGRAKTLWLRWMGHHRFHEFMQRPQVRIAWLVIDNHDALPDIEEKLIQHFHPPLNNYSPLTTQHKRGPRAKNHDLYKASFVLPRALWDWAAEQPEGASGLLRQLLDQERRRRTAEDAPALAGVP